MSLRSSLHPLTRSTGSQAGASNHLPLRFRFAQLNSLFSLENSLLFKIFSLLIRVGNCPKSHCGTATFDSNRASRGPKIAKFPVKSLLYNREFPWRQVRSALRRQRGSLVFRELTSDDRRKARKWRAFTIQREVSRLRFSTD
jgi:hypothetical protein